MKVITEKSLIFLLLISFSFAAISSVMRTEQQFLQSDMIAYKAASHVFVAGGNPYSVQEVFNVEKNLGYPGDEGYMIWNPPIIFVLFGFVFILPFFYLTLVWQTLEVFSGFLLLIFGWKCSRGAHQISSNLSNSQFLLYLSALLFISVPVILEIQTIQIALVLTALIILGIILFFQDKYFLSGIVLSSALIKPHIAFLPVLLLGLWVILEKRVTFIIGNIVGLSFLFLVATIINHDILTNWIFRESWPLNSLGASLTSLTFSALQATQVSPLLIRIAVPTIAIVVFIAWQKKQLLNRNMNTLFCALAFNPFVVPYGYVFDQVILLPVIGYIAGTSFGDSRLSGLKSIVFLVSISCIVYAMGDINIFQLPLLWFLYPSLIFITFLITKYSEERIK